MNKETKKVYDAIKKRANAFTKEELEQLIIADGFDKETAKDVIKELDKNKVKFKDGYGQGKAEDKDKILQDLSKTLTAQKNIEAKAEKPKPTEVEPKKKAQQGKNPLLLIANFFKRIYFFFEDAYYSVVDAVSKVIPINKLTDVIDKVIPSFLFFIVLIVALIWLLFFSGVSIVAGGVMSTVDVTVLDSTSSLLSGAKVILSINDNNLTKTTDAFGNAVFEEVAFNKSDNVKIIASKESYSSKTKVIENIQKNIIEIITLDLNMDIAEQLFLSEEQTYEILFKENSMALATRLLQVRLVCSNPDKTPNPSYSNVTNGRLSVVQPSGCGALRISVTSDYYVAIQNQEVPENNTILLTAKETANVGRIEVFVKTINGSQITGATISVYKPDDLTTSTINESNLVFMTGTTDYYGRYIFENVPQGSYTLSAVKDGYISSQRTGDNTVTVNNTTSVNLVLFSPTDLQNINCQNQLFSQFCKNGCLDCNNLALANYYARDSNGNLLKTGNCCQVGRLGYINVTLVDMNGNTYREIKGDITVYKKNADNNGYRAIETRRNTNSTTFYVLQGNYKLIVTNTEDYGYFPSEPVIVNEIDRNIIIPLEYSSALNSGTVGVNVKRNGYNYANALVYLFDSDEPDIPINFPKTTNSNGDINFTMMRANKGYFAFAVASGYQGLSASEELDANEFLQLSITLSNQAKILNLNVNVRDYNISFYSLTNQLITDYTVNVMSDTNKEFIFMCEQNEFYAIISAEGKGTYQTDVLSLIPGEAIYYKVVLGNAQNTAYANLEFLGWYDESGVHKLNSIDMIEYRNKTLKLKYKFVTTVEDNRELAYAFIRAGKLLTLSSDFLRIEAISAPTAGIPGGCNYHGDLSDWNESYFTANYEVDHLQSNCTNQNGYKWAKIDFSNSNADQIEFSVNIKFQNGLAPLDNYIVYSKGLTRTENDSYAFSPTLNNSWNNCNVRPEGYFYAPSNVSQIPFANASYSLIYDIYDWNNSQGNTVAQNGNYYELDISKSYLYTQKLIYLNPTQGISNKDINAYSINTNNSLLYQSFAFSSADSNQSAAGLNVASYKINSISAGFGSEFDHNSVFKVTNFFDTGAKISTNILEISQLNPFSRNVLSYYSDSNLFIEILTLSPDLQNSIYIGDNNVSFRVRNKMGNPIAGIVVKYQLSGQAEVELGETNENGFLQEQVISFGQNMVGATIAFKFSNFPIIYGLQNNSVTITKAIQSGYRLIHSNGQSITASNPLIYSVGRYRINNEAAKLTKDKKEYYIVKNSAYNPGLTIDVWGRQWMSIVDVNEYLHTQNTLPIVISDENQQIKTQLVLNSLPNNLTDVIGGYHNLLTIGTFENQPIVIDLNAGIKASKAFDVNLLLNATNLEKPGKAQLNGKPYIELIKGINPEVSFTYNLTNNSSTPIQLDINYTLPTDISGLVVNITPSSISIPANSTRAITVSYNAGNASPTEQEIPITLSFNCLINGIVVTEELENYVRIFSNSNFYAIKRNTQTPPWTQNVTCSKDSCEFILASTIDNKTKTYDFNLIDLNFIDLDRNFTLTVALPKAISSLTTQNINAQIVGDYEGLDYLETSAPYITYTKAKKLNYRLKMQNLESNALDVNATLNLDLTIIKQTVQQLLEEEGLYGNLCLGFGSSGEISASNFDIIGQCELEGYNACKSGSAVKPKIIYDWSANTNWNSECIDELGDEYDVNKTHCDSVQMLFSVFNLIQNNLCELKNGNVYIYLMADGTSADLLKDMINYNEFLSALNYSGDNEILAIEKVDNNTFTISKTEKVDGIDQYTTKPGKYKIRINDNFYIDRDSPLHIHLELVREMPYSMRNLLYYIPIDGKLGVDVTHEQTRRNGYGTAIINDTNLPVVSGPNGFSLYDTNDDYDSFVNIIVNNNDFVISGNQEGLRNTINSDGKLLNIRLDSIEADQTMYLTIDYSPSYPMPIYAKVVNGNSQGLNYKLKEAATSNYNLMLSSLIRWEDFNNSSKILKDDTFILGNGQYFKSEVLPSTFRQNYGNNNEIKLLKTMLYWPMSQKQKFSNMHISLEDTELSNHELTKIYTLANIDQNGSKNSGTFNNLSQISNSQNISSYSDVFNLVYSEDARACMESGLTSVVVRWDRIKTDFTQEQIDKVKNDYLVEQDDSGQGETGAEGGGVEN